MQVQSCNLPQEAFKCKRWFSMYGFLVLDWTVCPQYKTHNWSSVVTILIETISVITSFQPGINIVSIVSAFARQSNLLLMKGTKEAELATLLLLNYAVNIKPGTVNMCQYETNIACLLCNNLTFLQLNGLSCSFKC